MAPFISLSRSLTASLSLSLWPLCLSFSVEQLRGWTTQQQLDFGGIITRGTKQGFVCHGTRDCLRPLSRTQLFGRADQCSSIFGQWEFDEKQTARRNLNNERIREP